MNEMWNISSNPHIRDKMKSSDLMRLVLIALLPAAAFGVVNFGINALKVIILSVAASVLTEYVYEKGMHKKVTIGDYSAAVTGLLLALNLPASAPWYLSVLGSVFAILFVKQLFGGLGQNFMNPALAARCFLLISFAGKMTDFTYDAVSGATPLAAMKAGESVNVLNLFLGKTAGTIGETSTLAILIGAVILLVFKVIDLRIPLSCLLSFSVFAILFGGHGFDLHFLAAQLCAGGLMLGTFFMATDYVTSPITKNGQIVYGCIIGILTGVFRFLGSASEGVSYAIILSNLLVPLIEKVTPPTVADRPRIVCNRSIRNGSFCCIFLNFKCTAGFSGTDLSTGNHCISAAPFICDQTAAYVIKRIIRYLICICYFTVCVSRFRPQYL